MASVDGICLKVVNDSDSSLIWTVEYIGEFFDFPIHPVYSKKESPIGDVNLFVEMTNDKHLPT